MRRIPMLAALLISGALAPVPGRAVTVSGQVVDERGVGIFNVDLDFIDRDTGQVVFTPFDNTNAGGFYSTDVPLGRYDVLFRSPATLYLDKEVRDLRITGPLVLNEFLEDGFAVSGNVVHTSGTPLASIDLDFQDLATGDIIVTSQDFSQADGTFQVYVPDRTYDVLFTPPVGQPYAGGVLRGIIVTSGMSVGTVTLPTGYGVHLRLLGSGGVPLAGTDVDFEDAATGELLHTPRDNTDALGHVTPLLPTGSYHIVAKPAAITGLAWRLVPNVAVPGAAVDVGDVQLLPAVALTGTVRNEAAQPIAGADLDMIELATGFDIPTENDNTNATGAFSMRPHATTMDVVVKPPATAALAAAILRNVVVAGPLNLGVITLVAGHPITGIVRDVYGAPVAGADLDAFAVSTGLKHPTPNDNTDVSGAYSIRLPAGSWNLTATPPAGSGLLPATKSVTLSAPAVVDFILPSSTVDAPVIPAARGLVLRTASPNPFRELTRIGFDLPRAGDVRLVVFDVGGRTVRELVRGNLEAGAHDAAWNGRDESGAPLPSGVYFYRLEAPDGVRTGKAALTR